MMPGETILSGAPLEDGVSPFKVMHSPAGYYVGTEITNKDEHGEWTEPYSRETEYFKTEADAQKALESFNTGNGLTGMRT